MLHTSVHTCFCKRSGNARAWFAKLICFPFPCTYRLYCLLYAKGWTHWCFLADNACHLLAWRPCPSNWGPALHSWCLPCSYCSWFRTSRQVSVCVNVTEETNQMGRMGAKRGQIQIPKSRYLSYSFIKEAYLWCPGGRNGSGSRWLMEGVLRQSRQWSKFAYPSRPTGSSGFITCLRMNQIDVWVHHKNTETELAQINHLASCDFSIDMPPISFHASHFQASTPPS